MSYQDITKKVETLVERFKPIAEDFCNLKLEDITVETSSYGTVDYKPNKISIDLSIMNIFNDEDLLGFFVAQEMGNHIAYTLNPKAFEPLMSKDDTKVKMIIRGFRDYFCFKVIPKGMLSDDTIELADLVIRTYDVDNKGYNFFKKITENLGKQEAFNVIKSLDVTLEELENPDLYIERRRK